jgi:hypothetical protein
LFDTKVLNKEMHYHHCISTLLLSMPLGGSGKQDDSQLNGVRQLLVYAYDINILGRSIHTVKKNTEASVVGSNEIGLEVNADKTKYPS